MKETTRLNRRSFLAGIAAASGAAILAACGGETAPTVAPTVAARTGTTAAGAGTTAAGAGGTVSSGAGTTAANTGMAVSTTAGNAAAGAGTTAAGAGMAVSTAAGNTAAGAGTTAANTGMAAGTTAAGAGTGASTAAATTGGTAAAAPAVRRLAATKLRVAQFGSAENGMLTQRLLNDFKKVQPDVTVEVQAIPAPDWDGFAAKLLTQIAGGDIPDVYIVATEALQLFAGRKLISPITDLVMRDKAQLQEFFSDVHPALIEAMMYDGQLYSMPDNFNAANIFYSKGAFQKKGVPEPNDNWTKDDFLAAAPKLITRAGNRTTEYAYFWTNRMWGGALPWMFTNGSNVLTEEKFAGGESLWSTFYPNDPAAKGRQGGIKWARAQANSPANVEAVQLLADMTQKLNAAPSPTEADSSSSQIITTFANKQLAMYVGGGFLVRSLEQAGVKPDDYGVTFMPKWKGQRHQFGTAGYVISDRSPNKEAAWELLKWRISKDVMAANFKDAASVRSRRSQAQALFEGTYNFKGYKTFYDTLDKFPDTAPIPQPPQANAVTQIFTKYVGLAVLGEQPVQMAMDNMQRELTEALNRPI